MFLCNNQLAVESSPFQHCVHRSSSLSRISPQKSVPLPLSPPPPDDRRSNPIPNRIEPHWSKRLARTTEPSPVAPYRQCSGHRTTHRSRSPARARCHHDAAMETLRRHLLPFILRNWNLTVGVSTLGVPGPTSKLSPRVPAQMGRRETEHWGGREQAKGNPAAFVLPRAQVECACSRGLQASAWERARAFTRRPILPRGQPSRTRALDLPFIGVRRGPRCTMGE
jgi:hypothetical protein